MPLEILCAIFVAASLGVMGAEHQQSIPMSVCRILQNPARFSGHTVTVRTTIDGTFEAVVLEGRDCGKAIILISEAGRKDGNWPEFNAAVARKITSLDKRRLKVTIEGVFYDRVPYGDGYIRQLKATRILNFAFEDESAGEKGSQNRIDRK